MCFLHGGGDARSSPFEPVSPLDAAGPTASAIKTALTARSSLPTQGTFTSALRLVALTARLCPARTLALSRRLRQRQARFTAIHDRKKAMCPHDHAVLFNSIKLFLNTKKKKKKKKTIDLTVARRIAALAGHPERENIALGTRSKARRCNGRTRAVAYVWPIERRRHP